jgi:3-deoxy-manno-octulosonate cytidylyltransferase (CMP-KDO synthetase)
VKIVVVIPARYSSTRFPGKVLAKDTGKFLIQHTWEQANKAKLPVRIIIAADDKRVTDAAHSFGAECVMTSKDHQSGTDRIAEIVKELDVDIVINIQADEPEIDPENIDFLGRLLTEHPNALMATLATDFAETEQVSDANIVKVITDNSGRAIYFSRSAVPYDRVEKGVGPIDNYLRHIGIYAYRKDFLMEITRLPQTNLEEIEKLEQLRVIENGFSILVGKVKHTTDGIDTPEQYAEFVKRTKK